MGQLILVTGGARSGKSGFAEKLAASYNREVVYLATAQALDQEMELRIAHHKRTRPTEWITVEEHWEVPKAVAAYGENNRVILLDCVTLWLTNLMLQVLDNGAGQDLEQVIYTRLEELVKVVERQNTTLICVSNEVGWGVVPDNDLGRAYRDLAGRANQYLGRAAEQVYLVVAGYPMELKQPGSKILRKLEGDK